MSGTQITPPAGTPELSKNKAWVDATYGNDLTGEVDNMAAPFATMQAAANALKPFNNVAYNNASGAEIHVARGNYTAGIKFDNTFTTATYWKVIFSQGVVITKGVDAVNLHVFSADVAVWCVFQGPAYINHANTTFQASVFGPGFEYQYTGIDGMGGMIIQNSGWAVFNYFSNGPKTPIKNIARIDNYGTYLMYNNGINFFKGIGEIHNYSGSALNALNGLLTLEDCPLVVSDAGPVIANVNDKLTLRNSYLKCTVTGPVVSCIGKLEIDNSIIESTFNGAAGTGLNIYGSASTTDFIMKNGAIVRTLHPSAVALSTVTKVKTRLYGDGFIKGAIDAYTPSNHRWTFTSVVAGDTLEIKLPWNPAAILTYVVQPGDTPTMVADAFRALWLAEVSGATGSEWDLYFTQNLAIATTNLVSAAGVLDAFPAVEYFGYNDGYAPASWYAVTGTSTMSFSIPTQSDGFINLIPGSSFVQSQYV